ncbi:hypothetical protein GCM10023093_05750 [Nemorincola caseinilytica]|uniref:ABC-2 family transporter protein n=1 Tax=Nemorincola caseinilytica TaxID=2054315 RepID=A0ABP8N7P2_9BACT
MLALLSIEWLKLRKYRTFWVLLGLFALLLPLWNYEIASGVLKLGGSGKDGINLLNTAYSFPEVWANLGFWGSIFILFLSILVIIITTNEYSFRTNRQNVIDGLTRMQFFHTKVLLVVTFSLIITLYFLLLGVLFGKGYSGSFSGAFSDLKSVFYFFVMCLDYMGLALLLSFAIKRSGLAIGLFLLYSMIIENIAKGIINSYADAPYGNLLMLQCSDELLPFPLMMMTKAIISQVDKISKETYLAVTLGWCAVYYFAGRAILRRNDW